MQHYVLKDKNGYVKSFNLHQQDKTVMTTDLNDAHVFRQDDVHINILCSMHKDLEPIEVDFTEIKLPNETVKVKVSKCCKPTQKQIGGNHYQNLAIQPVEYCFKNKLDNLQSNVIKYVTRFKAKNGLQDLQKAKHYIDLLIQYNYIDK